PVLAVFGASLLAICPGCNPMGWGVSQVQSLIHHHAHKPVVRDSDLEPGAGPGVYRPALEGAASRPA
ncbi:MAG TPA: hypothetical protein VGN42_23010, partial [Pirellulales bacterium]|nr:hypothetical protein [Pirellulales bacterium]